MRNWIALTAQAVRSLEALEGIANMAERDGDASLRLPLADVRGLCIMARAAMALSVGLNDFCGSYAEGPTYSVDAAWETYAAALEKFTAAAGR